MRLPVAAATSIGAQAKLTADATHFGNGGSVEVWGGNNSVAGFLSARGGALGGDGGFIETSGEHVNIADSARVNTLAQYGRSGTWLIDPTDFTIAATGGDITGATLSNNLLSGNVLIESSQGASGTSGNINVDDTVSWAANKLTLTAANNININALMTASGSAGLVLNPATANGTASAVAGGTVIIGASGELAFGSSGVLTLSNAITDNGSLTFNQGGNLSYAGVISGTGALTQAGSGTLILTGANTYLGGTTISAGTLTAGNNSALGTGAVGMAAGSTLAFGANNLSLANAFTLNGAATCSAWPAARVTR